MYLSAILTPFCDVNASINQDDISKVPVYFSGCCVIHIYDYIKNKLDKVLKLDKNSSCHACSVSM